METFSSIKEVYTRMYHERCTFASKKIRQGSYKVHETGTLLASG